MAGYDPNKAATYNKLRQQGLSEDAAATQAGITGNDQYSYVSGPNGTLGPQIDGSSKVAGVDYEKYTPAELKEQARFNQGLQSVDYDVKADSAPSSKTPITYTTTSTEQVSGGGSTTTTAGVATANDRSAALQAQSDAKSAELKQYLADNPRNPNATPEEQAARRAKITELSNERGKLATAAEEAKTPGNPTETTVPNTTTNTSTVTYSQSSVNSDVETTAGPDPALNQTPSLEDTQVQSVEPQQVPVQDSLAPGEELINTGAPEPVQVETFNEGQSTITTVTDVPAPVDQQTFERGGTGQNAGTTTYVTTDAPADVGPETDPAVTGGGNPGNSTVNIGTDENRGGNQEAAAKQRAQEQAALQSRLGQSANGDWRVRIRLAPNATYLYKFKPDPGILAPLAASDGVIFPYTPTITTSYNANYDVTDLTHSNYRGQFYKNSNTGDINLNGIFTAQDTTEAAYMLAVIHFFRSVTKMFYGQDAERGAPPPLVYLSGFGPYQFNGHPCVVKTFNYTLPIDVDYVRVQPNNYGQNLLNRRTPVAAAAASNTIGSVIGRLSNAVDLLGNLLKPGALPGGAGSKPGGQPGVAQQAVYNTSNATYVPTKIEIQLTLLPIQSRNQVSQQFSLKDYANGSLLRGGFW